MGGGVWFLPFVQCICMQFFNVPSAVFVYHLSRMLFTIGPLFNTFLSSYRLHGRECNNNRFFFGFPSNNQL